MTNSEDMRRSAPAALRNRGPILEALRHQLPKSGTVLEVASGTGEHVVHFARQLTHLEWQPSDPSPEARRSIAAWIATEALPNLLPPMELDATQTPWPLMQVAAIICINMVHISPWQATVGLMSQAGRFLPRGGLLYLYGPFRRTGIPLEQSNQVFDRDLHDRDPLWGLRELADVIACGTEYGLAHTQTVEMPANNLSVIFRRT